MIGGEIFPYFSGESITLSDPAPVLFVMECAGLIELDPFPPIYLEPAPVGNALVDEVGAILVDESGDVISW